MHVARRGLDDAVGERAVPGLYFEEKRQHILNRVGHEREQPAMCEPPVTTETAARAEAYSTSASQEATTTTTITTAAALATRRSDPRMGSAAVETSNSHVSLDHHLDNLVALLLLAGD